MTIPAHIALARRLLAGDSPETIAADTSDPAIRRLLAERADSIARLRTMLAVMDHTAPADAAEVARRFDRAVSLAPEVSVAAWSLGDPALLAAATEELVDWLSRTGLIGPERDVLDLGCGIGRVAAILAPRCRSVLGVDAAPGMIAEAERRHAASNLRFAVVPGDGLAKSLFALQGIQTDCKRASRHRGASRNDEKGCAAFHLILAVDVFPYLVQEGVAERHVADAARLLRPGGVLAILNLSYRNDPALDRADAVRWAAAYGFAPVLCGATPFALWDGSAFMLARVARASV